MLVGQVFREAVQTIRHLLPLAHHPFSLKVSSKTQSTSFFELPDGVLRSFDISKWMDRGIEILVFWG